MRAVFMGVVSVIFALTAVSSSVTSAQGAGQGGAPAPQAAQAPQAATPSRQKPLPSIADRTDGFRRIDGFFPLYWDEAAGTLYLQIPQLDQDVLYVEGLSAGLGSNDIGLDRAQLGAERLVYGNVGEKSHARHVVSRLPGSVTVSIEAGKTYPFAVATRDLRFFDRKSGLRKEGRTS